MVANPQGAVEVTNKKIYNVLYTAGNENSTVNVIENTDAIRLRYLFVYSAKKTGVALYSATFNSPCDSLELLPFLRINRI